jgi:CRP/FNR family cyclic AMP-dependent transcriptional regulator
VHEPPRLAAETDLRTYGMTFWDFRPLVETNASIAWKLLESLAKQLDARSQPSPR